MEVKGGSSSSEVGSCRLSQLSPSLSLCQPFFALQVWPGEICRVRHGARKGGKIGTGDSNNGRIYRRSGLLRAERRLQPTAAVSRQISHRLSPVTTAVSLLLTFHYLLWCTNKALSLAIEWPFRPLQPLKSSRIVRRQGNPTVGGRPTS